MLSNINEEDNYETMVLIEYVHFNLGVIYKVQGRRELGQGIVGQTATKTRTGENGLEMGPMLHTIITDKKMQNHI